jgi:rRNA-processing protein FCF1
LDGAPSLPNDFGAFQGTTVLLDTNFLLLPFQRRIDIFEEIPRLVSSHVQFLVLPQVVKELEWLEAQGSSKERSAAKSSFMLVEKYCQKVEDLSPALRDLDADSAILSYAFETGAIVATNDGELRRKLVNQGSRAIFLRKLAVLALTE